MIKMVQIGGRDTLLAANAATTIRYKQIFHDDLMKMLSKAVGTQEEQVAVLDTLTQLTFVMCKQAEKADMRSLTEDDYIEWLEGYEPMDISNATNEIMAVYFGNQVATSKSKKK